MKAASLKHGMLVKPKDGITAYTRNYADTGLTLALVPHNVWPLVESNASIIAGKLEEPVFMYIECRTVTIGKRDVGKKRNARFFLVDGEILMLNNRDCRYLEPVT